MNALVLSIDGLSPAFLGCYGNGWVPTPAIDALAASGCAFDNALLDSTELERLARSWWRGWHAAAQPGDADQGFLLPARLEADGVGTSLVTDEPSLARHPLAAAFAERLELPMADATAAALSEDETHLARSFAILAERLAATREPYLLWAHLRGLLAPWDAPYDFRARCADEEDPRPPDFISPPGYRLAAYADPDELLGIRQAYAGQVALLDVWLEMLLAAHDERQDASRTMIVLCGARGFPLGVHGTVGSPFPDEAALYGERVHVPLLVRLPGGVAACRAGGLVQPADIAASLAEWFGLRFDESPVAAGKSWLPLIRDEAESIRDRAFLCTSGGETALRTAAWYFRQPAATDDTPLPPAELFAKPDDRHEVNEVSALRPGVVQSLRQALDDWQAAATNAATSLPPLDDSLAVAFHD